MLSLAQKPKEACLETGASAQKSLTGLLALRLRRDQHTHPHNNMASETHSERYREEQSGTDSSREEGDEAFSKRLCAR